MNIIRVKVWFKSSMTYNTYKIEGIDNAEYLREELMKLDGVLSVTLYEESPPDVSTHGSIVSDIKRLIEKGW